MTQNTLQSSYSRYATAGGPAGQIADMHKWDADTRILESSSVGFGLVVSQGSADAGAIIGGNTYCGITIRDITLTHSTADRYEQYDNIGVLTLGDVWVAVTTDVVKGKQGYYNTSTGALGASTISNPVAIAGAKWLDTVSSGGFARLRLSNAVGDITT